MKSLTKVVNDKVLVFNVNGCASSACFYFKIQDMIYQAFETNEAECDVNDDLFFKVLRVQNEVLGYFLNKGF